jgi:CRP-like cAMP-binding protein
MTDQIPEHVRPLAFGMAGLMREMAAIMRTLYGDDLEAALIMVCVTNATMQTFMARAAAGADILRQTRLPETIRGSISRRMIAEKTGLPRETVRRKVAALIAQGQLFIDDAGGIRSTPRLHDPEVQVAVSSAHDAVVRYVGIVGSYGVDQ